MDSSMKKYMAATGLPSSVVRERVHVAPMTTTQGTSVPVAGCSAAFVGAPVVGASAHAAAQAAVAGVRVIDLPGSAPRGAPV